MNNMENKTSEVCRICLQMVKNYEEISESHQDMMQIIVQDFDVNIIKENVFICQDCVKALEESFAFKSSCLEIEYTIHNYSNAGGIEVNLEKIMGLSDLKDQIERNTKICRTCLNVMDPLSYMRLDEGESPLECEMLIHSLPEVNKKLTIDPAMCKKCLQLLEKLYSFHKTCLDTERKIMEYLENNKEESGFTLLNVINFEKNQEQTSNSLLDTDVGDIGCTETDVLQTNCDGEPLIETTSTVRQDTLLDELDSAILCCGTNSSSNMCQSNDKNHENLPENMVDLIEEISNPSSDIVCLTPTNNQKSYNTRSKKNKSIIVDPEDITDDKILDPDFNLYEAKNVQVSSSDTDDPEFSNTTNNLRKRKASRPTASVCGTEKVYCKFCKQRICATGMMQHSVLCAKNPRNQLFVECAHCGVKILTMQKLQKHLQQCQEYIRWKLKKSFLENTQSRNQTNSEQSNVILQHILLQPLLNASFQPRPVATIPTSNKRLPLITSNNHLNRNSLQGNTIMSPALPRYISVGAGQPAAILRSTLSSSNPNANYIYRRNLVIGENVRRVEIETNSNENDEDCIEVPVTSDILVRNRANDLPKSLTKTTNSVPVVTRSNFAVGEIISIDETETNTNENTKDCTEVIPSTNDTALKKSADNLPLSAARITNSVLMVTQNNFAIEESVSKDETEPNSNGNDKDCTELIPSTSDTAIEKSTDNLPVSSAENTNSISTATQSNVAIDGNISIGATETSSSEKDCSKVISPTNNNSTYNMPVPTGDITNSVPFVTQSNANGDDKDCTEVIPFTSNKCIEKSTEILSVSSDEYTNLISTVTQNNPRLRKMLCMVETQTNSNRNDCTEVVPYVSDAVINKSGDNSSVSADGETNKNSSVVVCQNITLNKPRETIIKKPVTNKNCDNSSYVILKEQGQPSEMLKDPAFFNVDEVVPVGTTNHSVKGKCSIFKISVKNMMTKPGPVSVRKAGTNAGSIIVPSASDISTVDLMKAELGIMSKELIEKACDQYLVVLKCDKCEYNTRLQAEMENHILIHFGQTNNNENYLCIFCHSLVSPLSNFIDHMKMYHQNFFYQDFVWCVKCSQVVKGIRQIPFHVCPKNDLKVKMFKSNGVVFCMLCKFESKDMEIARQHIKFCVKKSTVSPVSEVIVIDDD